MKSKILCTLVLSSLLTPLAAQTDKKSPAALKKAAYNVDKFVAEIFRKKKLKVPSVVDDPTFLRRSLLVGAGRIPTLKEATSFLEIDDPNKREMLTGYLLQSDGYRSHMQNYIMDLLRARDQFNDGGEFGASAYMRFITESVSANMPWNEFVHKLISAQGSSWEKGNGSVGYYIRDKGMPLDNLSITMQIFTGERFECAQCHDSPTNQWERMDFYELAAFTHGQQEVNEGMWDQTVRFIDDPDFRRSELGPIMYWMRDNIHYHSISNLGDGRIALPKDYQYKDGDPGEMVGGKTHFGKKLRSSDRRNSGKSRAQFADWMTKENDNFNYVIVNRMWQRVMGNPITYPVDEYQKPEKSVSPGLVRYLSRLMVELDYDLKAFQNVLLLTKTFQFAGNPKAFEANVPQAFNGRQIERMSAEQVWDSLVTLVAAEPDKLAKRQYNDHVYYKGRPVMVGKKSMQQLAKEVLSIKKPAKYKAYAEELLKEFNSGSKSSGDSGGGMMMMARRSAPGAAKGIARASELDAPAPAGHLLRGFGQSDRTLIGSGTKEANMAQVLEVMNGHVEKMVVSNKGAAVYDALKAGTTNADKVRYIYYAILSRPPSDEEMNMLMRDVIDGSRESFQNLVSALVSTHEFMFIQ